MKTELKWYNLAQNNSGGYLIRDENVNRFISIQAPNTKIAKKIAEKILSNYREYCPCCGFRWEDKYLEEEDATKEPYVMDEPYKEQKDPFWCKNSKLIMYKYDGAKEYYDLEQNMC